MSPDIPKFRWVEETEDISGELAEIPLEDRIEAVHQEALNTRRTINVGSLIEGRATATRLVRVEPEE